MFWPFNKQSHKAVQPPFPEVTDAMKLEGLTWARMSDGSFHEVCDTCGGNCGQCGMTKRLGNIPFSFDRIVKSAGASF